MDAVEEEEADEKVVVGAEDPIMPVDGPPKAVEAAMHKHRATAPPTEQM